MISSLTSSTATNNNITGLFCEVNPTPDSSLYAIASSVQSPTSNSSTNIKVCVYERGKQELYVRESARTHTLRGAKRYIEGEQEHAQTTWKNRQKEHIKESGRKI